MHFHHVSENSNQAASTQNYTLRCDVLCGKGVICHWSPPCAGVMIERRRKTRPSRRVCKAKIRRQASDSQRSLGCLGVGAVHGLGSDRERLSRSAISGQMRRRTVVETDASGGRATLHRTARTGATGSCKANTEAIARNIRYTRNPRFSHLKWPEVN